MKKFLVLILMLLAISYGTAFALSFAGMHEITVNDGIEDSTYTGGGRQGSQALGSAGEDNETEKSSQYQTLTDQTWDLEGMFFHAGDLYVVGGYDFEHGYGNTTIGSLFLGDLNEATGAFNPEYALVQDANNPGSLTVYKGGDTKDTEYFPLSNPYQYDSGGTYITTGTIHFGTATDTGFSNDWGLLGDSHYYVKYSLAIGDWAAIIDSGTFAHLTMTCGNDSIRGRLSPVPEPTTMILSALGLLGVGCFMRRQRTQKQTL